MVDDIWYFDRGLGQGRGVVLLVLLDMLGPDQNLLSQDLVVKRKGGQTLNGGQLCCKFCTVWPATPCLGLRLRQAFRVSNPKRMSIRCWITLALR